MKNMLTKQDLYFTILEVESKPTDMSLETWKVLDEKAMSSMNLHLFKEVICNIMEEKSGKDGSSLISFTLKNLCPIN
ncbi:hypothetical protein ACOSQ2_021131 [Xanthoceras sorbifolium]